jgi:hypothetical protein
MRVPADSWASVRRALLEAEADLHGDLEVIVPVFLGAAPARAPHLARWEGLGLGNCPVRSGAGTGVRPANDGGGGEMGGDALVVLDSKPGRDRRG